MTDELDDLRQAMDAATPAPDARRRAADLALASKNFAALQGSQDDTRQTSVGTRWGLLNGVKMMLNTMTTRGGLTATTALVAAGLLLILPGDRDLLSPPGPAPGSAIVSDEVLQAPLTLAEDAETFAAEPMVLQRSIAKTADLPAAGGRTRIAEPGLSVVRTLPAPVPEATSEEFASAEANPLQITSETPVSTFSVDVDTFSYSLVRDSLTNGRLPDPKVVRIEEMVNYFTYDYAAPDGDAPFRPTVSVSQTPWNPDTRLVHIGLQGTLPSVEDRPPLNLVFLIDTSGSMNQSDKLPLLVQSFRLMLGQLRPTDEVSIVAYAGSAGEVLAPTSASERDIILAALDSLQAGGATGGEAGLVQAYRTAESMTDDGEVSRVILATDGDFNVGLSDPDALKDFIADRRDSGTYLSVLGFGRGNLDDATMQALAQNGNGTAAYIDTLAEAQKVLSDQLTGALFPIADDVKIQVEFNPAQIAEYRLIGYETRALRREDFNNDAVDAGEIGAGHSVTALYEVTPVGSPARLSDPLRYALPEETAQSDELGFLRLRYKAPGESVSRLIEQPIAPGVDTPGDNGFAAAIAGFGQLLRNSPYTGSWTMQNAIDAAVATRGEDTFGYRAEAIRLMRLAQSLMQR
ncbi:von Willebrand factor type A domain-containing protein [uncultured Roseobacter sp.]|uniref:vWA domain-containing protein n=1 Tax=uncultured Roseobacter sp. TaxID=114847 RepID=UPI0026197424|nr:von Willebrand factor type A domain-containing protein [uncultured Roseobacter sp.]